MTIDINELRRLMQDFKLAGSPMLVQTAQMSELLDRLEAAEKERDDFAQQLVQSEIGKRKISETHDALQIEVGKLKDLEVSRCVKINRYIVDNARLAEEVVRLRAKIEAMEKRLRLILEEPENTMSNSKALREMVRQARLALEESK